MSRKSGGFAISDKLSLSVFLCAIVGKPQISPRLVSFLKPQLLKPKAT